MLVLLSERVKGFPSIASTEEKSNTAFNRDEGSSDTVFSFDIAGTGAGATTGADFSGAVRGRTGGCDCSIVSSIVTSETVSEPGERMPTSTSTSTSSSFM
jgi:hypothetical protein